MFSKIAQSTREHRYFSESISGRMKLRAGINKLSQSGYTISIEAADRLNNPRAFWTLSFEIEI